MPHRSVRGMPDVLPALAGAWSHLESKAASVFSGYGLTQIRTPLVEYTKLFERSIGDLTDIVQKEMYTFEDRNGDPLTLRPEVTAGVVRAAIEHGLLHNQTQRFWYQGPAFRYERPQKGRYRQFHQIGVECFGLADPIIDAELIEITSQLWNALEIQDHVSLQLNSIGSSQARADYRDALVDYLSRHYESLDADSQNRLLLNPLRILDSKDETTQTVLLNAPNISNYLTKDDERHFKCLCSALDSAGIKYVLNQHLVRGLDYYGRTVFEWTTESLGAQGTVCGGGRYDGLVEQLGGKPTPGVGFAIGVERVVLLMQNLGVIPNTVGIQADIYLMATGEAEAAWVRQFARKIRAAHPHLKVMTHIGGGSLKSQLKKADKSGAQLGLIVGEDELANGTVVYKPLRGGEQVTINVSALLSRLKYIRDV